MESQASLETDSTNERIPFNQRWEKLKPVLEQLYREEGYELPKLVKHMKEQYGFDANESQYKYRFKQWGLTKSIPASKKRAIIDGSQRRALMGKSTVPTYKGKEVDIRKLRREAKNVRRVQKGLSVPNDQLRRQTTPSDRFTHSFGGRIFLDWNLPYAALLGRFSRQSHHPSPAGPTVSTPSDVSLHTPPADAPSPSALNKVLRSKTAIENAHLFVSGKHHELVKSLGTQEKIVLSTWLHEFWSFGFKTAKHWGHGPREWTAANLAVGNHAQGLFVQSPDLSFMRSPSISSPAADSPSAAYGVQGPSRHIPQPTQLCRWSIHVRQERYEAIDPFPIDSASGPSEIEDLHTEWPAAWHEPPFEQRLRDNLESNRFSNLDTNQLPIATGVVAKAARASPREMFEEALGFAIIGRNSDLVKEMLDDWRICGYDVSALYPYHLATTYLDGSRSCCQILELLVREFSESSFSRAIITNSRGHSVIDNLMITILKSHTSVTPGMVDDAMKHERHFGGEEIDICGRWDPESTCYSALISNGRSAIPFSWKHKFCHTSVQAVCHSIQVLGTFTQLNRTPSGLFLKHCGSCGLKLQLWPLHTLVLTAFYLGQRGCQDEDLFGMVCCLLCLLNDASELDVDKPANISLALLGFLDDGEGCRHELMSPSTLADRLTSRVLEEWPDDARIGWQVFVHILRECEIYDPERDLPPQNREFFYLNYPLNCDDLSKDRWIFGQESCLGHIWASAQTEILTYRRLNEGDPWVSENFSMRAALQSLETHQQVSMALVTKLMMQPYCACGFLDGCGNIRSGFYREEAAKFYFSNLEDWERTTFIDDTLIDDIEW